jgi:ferredoxin
MAGWSAEGKARRAKIAALLAGAALPDPEAVAQVDYKSDGQLLIIGPSDAALDWAGRLAGTLAVNVLLTGKGAGEQPGERSFPVWSGKVTSISGWLGAFEVEWTQDNPIDLDLCTRCNACLRACPEGAIDFSYQIDMDKCKGHRECVKACGPVNAIDFARQAPPRKERFDLVLDLSRQPLIAYRTCRRATRRPALIRSSRRWPRRSSRAGGRIQQAALHAVPRTHLRARPLGQDRLHAVPGRVLDRRNQRRRRPRARRTAPVRGLRRLRHGLPLGRDDLRIPAGAGPRCAAENAAVHLPRSRRQGCLRAAARCRSGTQRGPFGRQGRRIRRARAGRQGRRPRLAGARDSVECFHIASIGIDLLLGAVCYGASQVALLATGREPEGYIEALKKQMSFAEAILNGLGYAGAHFTVLNGDDLENQLWNLQPAATVLKAATFNLSTEKRTSLDFAFDFLSKSKPGEIPLPAGAPFGAVAVNKQTCTLCKACISACPEGALLDSPEGPVLKFIERNCVQCGLCEKTCPEDAIRLAPRLLLGAQAKEAVTLNEAEPFDCVKCGKPFGTRLMVENMTGRSARTRCSPPRRAQAPADVRRLPRHRHGELEGRALDLRFTPDASDRSPSASERRGAPALQPGRRGAGAIYGLIARLYYAAP